ARHLFGTVTSLIGRCGSITGNTTNSSRAATAATSSNVCSTFIATAPGRWRQIHTYISQPIFVYSALIAAGIAVLYLLPDSCFGIVCASTAWMISRLFATNFGWHVVTVMYAVA